MTRKLYDENTERALAIYASMTEQQPEALRLADELEAPDARGRPLSSAAAELRRLHTVNAGLLNQNTELDKKLAELEAEGLEQARIIGMGAERELRLMAQVDELERALGIAGKAFRLSIEQAERLEKQPTKILGIEEMLKNAGFYKAEKQAKIECHRCGRYIADV